MYENLDISMVQFNKDRIYEDQYQLRAEINGVTVESYVVKTLSAWAQTLKCDINEVKTRVKR